MIANGGVATFKDVQFVLKESGADGVMVGESILGNPALFANSLVDLDTIAHEYLDFYEDYPGETTFIQAKAHVFQLLYKGLMKYTDLKKALRGSKTLP